MKEAEFFAQALRALIDPVREVHEALREVGAGASTHLGEIGPTHRASATNLLQYLAFRRHDLRDLQDRLASVGLSSLGRAEPCVSATVGSVLELLSRGAGVALPARDPKALSLSEGQRLLERNTAGLFGPPRPSRRVRILVTMPSAAADDPSLVRNLVARGMDMARVNCAHDGPEAWSRMIAHVRRASVELGQPCRVLMDLAGPKLRTGALPPGPEVVKIKPTRNAIGEVIAPALVWLTGTGAPPPAGVTSTLPVSTRFLATLSTGAQISLVDARGADRRWTVEVVSADGACVATTRTAYVVTGTLLRTADHEARVGRLRASEQALVLRPGSRLLVTKENDVVGAGAVPRISCTLPQVFADVSVGDRIWFDDGAIGGHVVDARCDRLEVEITEAKPGGSKLRADKGINLPDTRLRLPALDPKDEQDLRFVVAHADLVGQSFVRRPSDVLELHARLAELRRRDMGVILKIETRDAFENLPQLLLAAMRRPSVGVMIARGDLAVECGWERLAELQEEILWICEAAHVPVVWATQVLEQLAKEGRPSRAEITDAAMAERAECVMLNKGEHLLGAVEVLDDILRRMEAHQTKKRSMLRPLALAERFAHDDTKLG